MENLNENIKRLRQIMSYDRSRGLLVNESQYELNENTELTDENIQDLISLADAALSRTWKPSEVTGDREGGGGLVMWNDNVVPELDDKEAEERYIKDYYEEEWHQNDDIDYDIPMSDKIPHLLKGYRDVLRKHYDGEINLNDPNRLEENPEGESLSDYEDVAKGEKVNKGKKVNKGSSDKVDVKKLLMNNALEYRNTIQDPYDFAENVFAATTEDIENSTDEKYRRLNYDEIYELLKKKHTNFVLTLK